MTLKEEGLKGYQRFEDSVLRRAEGDFCSGGVQTPALKIHNVQTLFFKSHLPICGVNLIPKSLDN